MLTSPNVAVAVALKKRSQQPREPRPVSTMGRAERDGKVMCHAVMVVVRGKPGRLGLDPTDDLTVWFYGALDGRFERELEDLAALDGELPEDLPVLDFVLQAPGGELRLEGCRIGAPVRYAGPANTLEYSVSHDGSPEARAAQPAAGLTAVA